MGGHGGLNILPQKRWNVYNFDNREKVRRDEEAAAKEEQLKREQSRKRDTEFRIEQLRVARGLAPTIKAAEPDVSESKSGHINLFEGIKIFDPVKKSQIEGSFERDDGKRKKMKKEEVGSKSVPVSAEDEKYRLGYGVAGKGIKLPWYLEKPKDNPDAEKDKGDGSYGKVKDEGKKKEKRTVEELREERLKREKREKERERALMVEKKPRRSDIPASRDRGYSRSHLQWEAVPREGAPNLSFLPLNDEVWELGLCLRDTAP